MNSFKNWALATASLLILLPSISFANEVYPLATSTIDQREKINVQLECVKKTQNKCDEYDVVVEVLSLDSRANNTRREWIKGLKSQDMDKFQKFFNENSYIPANKAPLIYIGTLAGIVCAQKCHSNALKFTLLPLGIVYDLIKAPFAIPYAIGVGINGLAEKAKLKRIFKKLKRGVASKPIKVPYSVITPMMVSFDRWQN